jgi:salicylate hydroxylase
MLPHLGQGAAQAIEDAAVLGILCGGLNGVSEVQGRLELFERARKERVGAIQILSTIPVGVDSTEGAREKFRDFLLEGDMPSKFVMIRSFLFISR